MKLDNQSDSGAESSGGGPAAALAALPGWAKVAPYVSIARPDHWFKNVFMLAGVALAYFYQSGQLGDHALLKLIVGFFSTCIVASSNYVLNEILDAPTDRAHPQKQQRPIPSGLVSLPIAYLEWIALGCLGLGMAFLVNQAFFVVSCALLFMGLIYNVPPIRSKELPYLDVLSESVNNPLRLMLGWYVVIPLVVPPASLLISYWMVGAFFMASKRFAEYRAIDSPESAASYRRSFRYYDDNRLLVSMFFYASAAALFLGVFIIRYHLELILSMPLIAGFFSYYMYVTLKSDSPVQNPERLYSEKGLMTYLAICVGVFVLLMFVEIPQMYDMFNVNPSRMPALWRM